MHGATVEEIARHRAQFADKKTTREFLGVSRKQFDLLLAAGFLAPCVAEELPPLVDGHHDLRSLGGLVRGIAGGAREHEGPTVAFGDINLRFTTDTAGLTEVFRRIADMSLHPAAGSTSAQLAAFRFSRSEVDAILTDVRRCAGMTMQEVSRPTGWKGQCIAEWCRQGLLHSESYEHAGRVGRMIDSQSLARFQMAYIPVAQLAKQIETSPRALISHLEATGIETVGAIKEGAAWRGRLVSLTALGVVIANGAGSVRAED